MYIKSSLGQNVASCKLVNPNSVDY